MYLNPQDARIADLVAVTSEKTEPGDYPRAAAVRGNVLIYEPAGEALTAGVSSGAGPRVAA
jgi:hypothetical protein